MSILTAFTVTIDDVIERVPFEIQADDRSGVYQDWIIKSRTNQTPIPGTNRVYIEHMGYDPARVTWTLSFTAIDDYNRLLALYVQTGTLTVLYGYQSLKGVSEHLHGIDYEHLDNVLLLDIDDTPHFVDGSVETQATWQRAVDPVTRRAVIE